MTEEGGSITGVVAILAVAHLPTLLLLIALGLWLGRERSMEVNFSIVLLIAGMACGLALFAHGIRLPEAAPAFLALLIGVFVALDQSCFSKLQPVLFLIAGLLIGLASSVSLAVSQAILSVIFLVMVPVAIGFYLSLLPEHSAVNIGRRVLGSWILAVSLLMVAFHLKAELR